MTERQKEELNELAKQLRNLGDDPIDLRILYEVTGFQYGVTDDADFWEHYSDLVCLDDDVPDERNRPSN